MLAPANQGRGHFNPQKIRIINVVMPKINTDMTIRVGVPNGIVQIKGEKDPTCYQLPVYARASDRGYALPVSLFIKHRQAPSTLHLISPSKAYIQLPISYFISVWEGGHNP